MVGGSTPQGASFADYANVGLSAVNLGMNMIQGALAASANRQKARAEMSALTQSWMHNKRVMEQNMLDTYASQMLQSWGAGIKGTTGSTGAIISQNQNILREDIAFQEQQYNTQMKNLKAQSKQKYLGLF